jgi:hypothetical protein
VDAGRPVRQCPPLVAVPRAGAGHQSTEGGGRAIGLTGEIAPAGRQDPPATERRAVLQHQLAEAADVAQARADASPPAMLCGGTATLTANPVSIIDLVDEVTGYQRDRARDALAKILEDFIAKELQPYVPTFPPQYYEGIFKLRGLEYPKDSIRRPLARSLTILFINDLPLACWRN